VKRALLIAAVLIAVYAIFLVQPSAVAQGNNDKVDVCHVPPGNIANAHIISVDAQAWYNGHNPHNAHDMDGLCPGSLNCQTHCGTGPQ